MVKKREITVQDNVISVINHNNEDYISLTDMVRAKEGDFFIEHWLRNRNTVEFLGIWESINNPNFNYVEFDGIKIQAGLNSFSMSVKEFSQKTGAIGLIARAGRYGGTYAHKDIAFEFGTWISPAFKLYLIKEFQRLKEAEGSVNNLEWNFRRSLAATNYRIQTDAIKEKLIPWGDTPQKSDVYIYAEEAELVNLALFGITSKQWKEKYPKEAGKYKNIRDLIDTNRLIVLSNLESLNAMLIRRGTDKMERFEMLREAATSQLTSLNKMVKDPVTIESPHKRKLLENN
jgi:hypothetical protein